MVEFMQPLKNTCLKEIQWRKKILTKYQWWARGLGQETLYALVQFWKNTPICQVCAEIYVSVTSDYFKGLETRFLFSWYFLIFAKVCILSMLECFLM